ncbi:MAG: hypothetical protein NT068_00295, partial [Candidatus Nomurabacteria bacterium]|nr:hypothetical protein [Candidatus Nomurabacteria bacterium]
MKKTYLSILALVVLIILGSFSFLKIKVNAASSVPSLAIRIVENNNLTNDVTNTATGNNPYPGSSFINTNQSNGISIYWAADNPSLLDYNSCRAQTSVVGSTAWSWNGASGSTATLIPLNWSAPILDYPTVATKYIMSCKSLVSGNVNLISEITVTPSVHITPPALKLRVFESGNATPVISSADNAHSTDSQSMTITSGNSISLSWAADTVSSTLTCNASAFPGNTPWNWGNPGYSGTSISPTLVWSSSVTDTPTVTTNYFVSCKSLIGGPALMTTVVVTPIIIPVLPPALSLKMVNGTSAPVFSNANNTTPLPVATAMNIPLGTSINISWA